MSLNISAVQWRHDRFLFIFPLYSTVGMSHLIHDLKSTFIIFAWKSSDFSLWRTRPKIFINIRFVKYIFTEKNRISDCDGERIWEKSTLTLLYIISFVQT